MRILWIGTKPPLPAIDGGRLAAAETLRALADNGVRVDLVAPSFDRDTAHLPRGLAGFCRPHLVPVHRPGRLLTLQRGVRTPLSIARHFHPSVRAQVEDLLEKQRFDVVHVEQLQAFAQARPALARGIPLVLRAQNVESDLWRRAAPWASWETRRLAAYERRALRCVAATIALSDRDAARLSGLAGSDRPVTAIPPPFPADLPPAEGRLSGSPPLVLMGSAGWPPNREANRWFVKRCWPTVLARVPNAVLHIFAADSERPPARDGVVFHRPPDDSAGAFPSGGVLVVPLRVGSGVRMKILEAWARGVCVVTTCSGVSGLAARDGEEVLVAGKPSEFAGAIHRLAGDSRLKQTLVAGGRRALEEHHHPRTVADRMLSVYTSVVG